ncbi:MAG: hypothetical protein NTV05_17950 [Acidobacteria bacterium]|nr:hypothetical protein [Acidobacteriota bacterium]
MSGIFKHLLILGRPACGKSEFIDFLKHTPEDVRRRRLHIGRLEEVDDFPWLWEKFQDDDARAKAGQDRLYTQEYMPGNPGMAPKGAGLFDWCIQKFNDVITKQYLDNAESDRDATVLIEFSRGGRDGFGKALGMLDRRILEPAAILYIQVSREESWRRNVARYQEKLKHSILAHMVPRETYDFFYDINDWESLTSRKSSGLIDVNGLAVPFVSMNNEPESTDSVVLEERYAGALTRLWELRSART